MPRSLVRRAEDVLVDLESSRKNTGDGPKVNSSTTQAEDGVQMSFFQLDDPALEYVRDKLLDLDIDNLTPIDALMKLHEIRKVVGGK